MFQLLVLFCCCLLGLQAKPISSDEGWCPQFHLIRSPAVCDASGPIKIGEKWHVFEDSCDWCHWISDDLIHWEQVSNAPFTTITGSIGYPNSGDNVVAFFGVPNQTIVVRATNDIVKDPSMQSWDVTGVAFRNMDKARGNFRDPSRPIYLNGKWYIAMASGAPSNSHGEFLWFEATDDTWTDFNQIGSLYNVTHTFGTIDTSTIMYNPKLNSSVGSIECPDVFPIKNKIVLMASLFTQVQWWVGTINSDNTEFTPETMGLIDYGNFYAGKTGTSLIQSGDDTLRILFGFTGWQEPTAPAACGRSHIIPRYISLSNKNQIQFDPVSEIETLHVESTYVHEIIDQSNKNVQLNITGSELQIKFSCLTLDTQVSGNVSINVLVSDDNTQFTQVGYNFDENVFYANHQHCCSAENNNNNLQIAPFSSENMYQQNGISMNILVDRSIIESFGNHQIVLTSMVSPSNVTLPNDRKVIFNGNQGLSCEVEAWNLEL